MAVFETSETEPQRRSRIAAKKLARRRRRIQRLDTRQKCTRRIQHIDAKIAALLAYEDGTQPITSLNGGIIALQEQRARLVTRRSEL